MLRTRDGSRAITVLTLPGVETVEIRGEPGVEWLLSVLGCDVVDMPVSVGQSVYVVAD